MSDYQELKRLAEAATPGKWSSSGSHVAPTREEGGTLYVESWRSIAMVPSGDDREFIAAANPAVVLALIGQNDYLELELSGVERAKQELAEKLGCADEPRWKWLLSGADDLTKERDQLKAEVETLSKGCHSLNGALTNTETDRVETLAELRKSQAKNKKLNMEVEELRKALIAIREKSDSLWACETAADALIDSRK